MSFSIKKVEEVSNFLQNYMKVNGIKSLSADKAAQLLAENGILPNAVGPKPAFNFRQMLREGRDKKIPLVKGAFQERPKTKWIIYCVENDSYKKINLIADVLNKSKKIKTKKKPIIVECENELSKPVYGLKPIIDKKTKILILGTFPAKESIDENFYYQNQNKRFWGQALSYIAPLEKISNEERKSILLEKGIGLWDIFECVEREKSNQDKSLKKAKYNDLKIFLKKHTSIKYLLFNSANSFNWLKEDKPEIFKIENLETKRLQSTSGQNGNFNQGKDWEDYFKKILK